MAKFRLSISKAFSDEKCEPTDGCNLSRGSNIGAEKSLLLFEGRLFIALFYMINHLPDMSISSNSAGIKDIMSKILTNGDTVI